MTDHPLRRTMNLLVVGQSHVGAVRAAAAAQRAAVPGGFRTRVIHTMEPRYGSETIADEAGGVRFSPALAGTIREQVALHAPRVASVMGGNVHNVLSLVRYERPFDFLLSGEASPPLDPHAEIVPEALVRAALERRLEHDRTRLRLLRDLAGPYIHVESPPPVGDDAYMAAHADAWFRIEARATAVAPRALRYRVWRLNARIVRAAVEALGCRYLPVPPETLDADGFLKVEFAGDATHGNAAYGEALIRALEAF